MTYSLKSWQGVVSIIGADFGDSGKGRMIDDLSARAQIVARYAGGANAGHTVNNSFGQFALHIVPSGIFNSKVTCLVGRNVALSLESLFSEIETLKKAKVKVDNLVIDDGATLTMPYHLLRDGLREKLREIKIGTTLTGVGPTYADRTERVGLTVGDLVADDLKEKLYLEVAIQNKFFNLKLKAPQIYERYRRFAQAIKPYVGKTALIVKEAIKRGRNILFEGNQGWLLDLDGGTYPFVTSSNPGVIGIWRSFDLPPSQIDYVIGITKAYLTRVGEGPLPTKMDEGIADLIVKKGREFGTTTGRRRTPGWLDLVLLKAAVEANEIDALAITKLDVLTGLKRIKVAVGYKMNGKTIKLPSLDAGSLLASQPVYEELPAWGEDISRVRSFGALPKNAKLYIKFIQKAVGVPVKFISVGPKRGEVIYV